MDIRTTTEADINVPFNDTYETNVVELEVDELKAMLDRFPAGGTVALVISQARGSHTMYVKLTTEAEKYNR